MVVANFDIVSIPINPSEAYSPLIVDPDRMLAFPIAPQLLQPIAWRYTQVPEIVSRVNRHQLSPGPFHDVWRERSNVRRLEKLLRQFVVEISYHDFTTTDRVRT